MKPKKCKSCKTSFKPVKPLQMVCSPICALEYSKANRAKRIKAETKEIKNALLTRSDYTKMLQQVFNSYIRIRDKHLPCISCGTSKPNIQFHSGHYRSVGACPQLRFEELNVHKQCSACNNHLSGNLIEYRKGLIKRIGVEQVEWLEQEHEFKKYSIDEIKELIKQYKLKIKNESSK